VILSLSREIPAALSRKREDRLVEKEGGSPCPLVDSLTWNGARAVTRLIAAMMIPAVIIMGRMMLA